MLEAEDLRIARRRTAAYLIAAISLGVIALAILFYVLWQIFASVKATPFDADGVRCYAKADQTVCLKTAEPPR
jgi:hypothetical protein